MHAPTPPEIAGRGSVETRPAPSFAEFVVLVAMMMAITAFAVDNMLPAFPVIGTAFQVADPNRVQMLVFVYMLGFGVSQLAYGPASDIMGRRPAYMVGLLIFLVGSVVAIFATSFAALLVARFVQGVGAASGRVLSVAIVRDRFSGREMSRVMSLTMVVFIMVPVFAPAVGSLILLFGDWQAIFVVTLLFGIGLGVWFQLRMPETLKPEDRMPFSAARIAGGVRMTLGSRLAVGYATAVGLLFGCIMGMVGSAQQIFTEVYGLGPWFPLAFGCIAACMGVASFLNSTVVRRFGMRRISHTSTIGVVVCGLAQLGFALAFDGRPPLLVFAGLLGLSQFLSSFSFPNFNALAMEPLGRVAGTAASLMGCYTTIVGVTCGILIGGAFNGTVLPIAIGYLVLASLTLGVVAWTERGRLFQPHHPDPA